MDTTRECEKYILQINNYIKSMNSIFIPKKEIAKLELLIQDYTYCMKKFTK
jgi:hypothetical protein